MHTVWQEIPSWSTVSGRCSFIIIIISFFPNHASPINHPTPAPAGPASSGPQPTANPGHLVKLKTYQNEHPSISLEHQISFFLHFEIILAIIHHNCYYREQ